MLIPTLKEISEACAGNNNPLELDLYSEKGILLIEAGSKEEIIKRLLISLKETNESGDTQQSEIIDKRILSVIRSKENEFVLFNSVPNRGASGFYISRPYSTFIKYDCQREFPNKFW